MNHSVLALAHFVSPLRLPIRHPLEPGLARGSQRILLDKTFVIVGDLLPRVAQMLHVRLGGRAIRRPSGFGVFVPGKLEADQVTCGRWSQQLGVSERPLGTKIWTQSTEELQAWSAWEWSMCITLK